jgi:rubrerythrin
MNFCFIVLDILVDICYDCIVIQTFANPRQSEELKEMMRSVARDEYIHIQAHDSSLRQENSMLKEELVRLQRERIEIINEYTSEIKRIHSASLVPK